ncbi:MAG TPA: hypothetical protein GXZ63_00065 [Mollicutes bacterium]|jgi:dipeptidase|nr:hypothetical protein [Mollicutes bacterium]
MSIQDLRNYRAKLTYFKNNKCNHPLWFLEETHHDYNDDTTYWTCTCVACELRKKAPKQTFENVVTGYEHTKHIFKTVQQEYNKLYNTGKIQDTLIGKVLVKKFKK